MIPLCFNLSRWKKIKYQVETSLDFPEWSAHWPILTTLDLILILHAILSIQGIIAKKVKKLKKLSIVLYCNLVNLQLD